MKRRVFAILLILILILIQSISFADSFYDEESTPTFEMIGREDGLLDLSVSDIIEDKYGFIWFATQGGLFRYDGYETEAFRNDPFDTEGLIHNLIQTMFYDESENVIWLGTYQGISRFDVDARTFINYTVEENHLSNNIVIAINKDAEGNMWFGTMDGLNRLDTKSGLMIQYPIEASVVRSLFIDENDTLFIGTYAGLCRYNQATDKIENLEVELPSPYVMAIDSFNKNELTLGLWEGGILTLDQDFNIISEKHFEDDRIYTFIKTHDGTLWAGSWGGGLFSVHDYTESHYPGTGKAGDIGHPVVYSFLEDTSGLLWIGTNGGGVYKTNPHAINKVLLTNDPDDDNTLDAGKINTLYEDSEENIWVAVYNQGINRYNEKTQKLTKYNVTNQKLIDDQVMDFLKIEDKLYVATGVDIAYYDKPTDSFIRLNLFEMGTIIYALAIDQDNHIWVGTYLDGVYEFDTDFKVLNHFNVHDTPVKLSDDLIYDIHVDKDNKVWIGTNNGLDVYDQANETMTMYYKEKGNYNAIASNTIRSLTEDDFGNIWLAMVGGGAAIYNPIANTFKSYTETDGLIDNTAISVVNGPGHKMWVATHGGISVIDTQTDVITSFSQSDGIGGSMFTGEGFVDETGNIYFGGTHGITLFPSGVELALTRMPKVYITELEVNGSLYDTHSSVLNNIDLTFDSDERYISLTFSALDYETLSQVQYAYKLEGVDNDWIESGTRHYATYSNLDAGNYTFKVRIRNLQGEYSEPALLHFEIKEHWYNTTYAYIVYSLMIILLIYGLYRVRESQMIEKRNQELNSLNSKLEEAVAELEAVSIKDPLTGIYNRRYFDMMLKEQLQLAKRSNSYLSLIMIDVDDFKHINDAYGHLFGDAYLIAFANQIQEVIVRSTDFCARYGGDEFIIVLYDTDLKGAQIVSQKIFNNIKHLQVADGDVDTMIESTVSIGSISLVPTGDMDEDHFIEKADAALYDAKRAGKNQIVNKDQ